jgi:hypothetical protein
MQRIGIILLLLVGLSGFQDVLGKKRAWLCIERTWLCFRNEEKLITFQTTFILLSASNQPFARTLSRKNWVRSEQSPPASP